METLIKQQTASTGLKKPRVGFAGVGWIGRSRMQTLIASNLIEPVAIAEPAEDMLKESLKLADDAKCFSRFEDMLNCDLDAIVIATPNSLHKEQAIAALESGAAVFCQKPLALTGEQTKQIIQTAKKTNRLLGVDFSYRAVASAIAVYNCILNQEIGNIYAVDLVFHNAYGPGKSWFYDVSQSGGGCVIDLGIHLIDLSLWMLSFPEITNCRSTLFSKSKIIKTRAVEDYATIQFDTNNDISINLACSWNLSIGCGAIIGATFYGSNGTAVWRNVNGSFFDFEAVKFNGTNQQVLFQGPDEWFGKSAVNWAKQVSQSNKYDAQIEKVNCAANLIDMIYECK